MPVNDTMLQHTYLSLFESKSAYLHRTAIFSGNNKYGKRIDGHGPAYTKIMP